MSEEQNEMQVKINPMLLAKQQLGQTAGAHNQRMEVEESEQASRMPSSREELQSFLGVLVMMQADWWLPWREEVRPILTGHL